jgi:predicted GIY-YIG superfamily endonuclease
MRAHHEGHAAAHTFKHRPVSLVYSESVASEELAIRRERQIKGWSRAKKEALISGDFARLKSLSKG